MVVIFHRSVIFDHIPGVFFSSIIIDFLHIINAIHVLWLWGELWHGSWVQLSILIDFWRRSRIIMYVSSIKMKARFGKSKEILQTLSGISSLVMLEKGCLRSHSYQDINDENNFFLIGEWETQQDLDKYLKSDLFSILLGIKTILVDAPEVKILVEESLLAGNGNNSLAVH